MRPRLDAARRTADFAEVVGGLDADTALYEARRCMSCGNCFGCDNCLGVCPDNAVHLIDGADGYAFDYDYCKGFGLCAAECPCGAIVMEPDAPERADGKQVSGPVPAVPFGPHRTAPTRAAWSYWSDHCVRRPPQGVTDHDVRSTT